VNRSVHNTKRRRYYKGFILETGTDGLITILDLGRKPLTDDMKFLEIRTTHWFLDHWLAAQD